VSSYHLYPCVLMYLCILVSSYHLYQVSSKSNLSWQRINKLSKSWRETTMVADPVNPSSPLTFGDWPSQPIITADLWWLTQSTHYHRWPLVTDPVNPSSPLTFGDWPSQPIITADLWWLTQSTHHHRWPLMTDPVNPSSPLTFGGWPSQPIITADLWWHRS